MRRFSFRMITLQVIVVLLLCGIQTTIWPALFGHIQSPQLWLPWVIFLALYRPHFEALFVSYIFGMIMLGFTSLGLKIIWPAMLILVGVTSFTKNKLFWPGLRYFTIATALSCLLWNVTIFVMSAILENPSAPLVPIERTLEFLLTVLASPFVYGLMMWLENLRPQEFSKANNQTTAEVDL